MKPGTLWLNDVAVTFLLVSSSGTDHAGPIVFCARSRPKKRTKTSNQNFANLYDHLPLLTMIISSGICVMPD